jgi:hypothetical protein
MVEDRLREAPSVLKVEEVPEDTVEMLQKWMDNCTTTPLQVCEPPPDRIDDLESMFHALEDYMMETKRIAEQNRRDLERISALSRRLKGAATATLVLLIASVGATLLTAMLSMGII